MGESLSQYWRVSKSPIKSIEFTEVLRSLQRLANNQMGSKSQVVSFKSAAGTNTGDQTLMVNPKPLLDAEISPLPDEAFDVLAGNVLRQTAKEQTGSDILMERVRGTDKILSTLSKAGESFVLDNYYHGKQAKYIQKSKEYYRKEIPEFEPTGHPVIDALKAYVRIVVDGAPVSGLDQKATDLLIEILNGLKGVEKLNWGDRLSRYQTTAYKLREAMAQEAKQQLSMLVSPALLLVIIQAS